MHMAPLLQHLLGGESNCSISERSTGTGHLGKLYRDLLDVDSVALKV